MSFYVLFCVLFFVYLTPLTNCKQNSTLLTIYLQYLAPFTGIVYRNRGRPLTFVYINIK